MANFHTILDKKTILGKKNNSLIRVITDTEQNGGYYVYFVYYCLN